MKQLIFLVFILASCSPSKTIQLDGSKSFDPDGYIVKYQWRQIYGKPSVIANPAAVKTTTQVKAKNVFGWELTVTDNKGAIDKDTTTFKN